MAIGLPDPTKKGTVCVLERTASGWVVEATLNASDGDDFDEFGHSVAIEGNTLVVGAPLHGPLGAQGAVYVFERQPDGTWLETTKIDPPETDTFVLGWSVDIDGDRLALGARGGGALGSGKGKVFIYQHEGSSWVKKTTIKPVPAQAGDNFAASLDLEGDRLVVGASYAQTGVGPHEGLAFVFDKSSGVPFWSQKAKFSPGDLTEFDAFGTAVALQGDKLIVGAPQHSLPTIFAGAVYVFELLSGVWTETAKLSTSDQPILTRFGWSVDFDGGRLVAGASEDGDVGAGAGAAYLFEEQAGIWTETAKFFGSELIDSNAFGYAVDVDGTQALIGAPGVFTGYVGPGGAYLFDLDGGGASLLGDTGSVSVSRGGSQELQLGACPERAGHVYFLAGTSSGTAPGFFFGGFPIPLNVDPYFLFTVNHPDTAPLTGSFGTFDTWGKAIATFSIPSGSSVTLVGLVLHHAYTVLDPTSLALEAVSPAIPISLEP